MLRLAYRDADGGTHARGDVAYASPKGDDLVVIAVDENGEDTPAELLEGATLLNVEEVV